MHTKRLIGFGLILSLLVFTTTVVVARGYTKSSHRQTAVQAASACVSAIPPAFALTIEESGVRLTWSDHAANDLGYIIWSGTGNPYTLSQGEALDGLPPGTSEYLHLSPPSYEEPRYYVIRGVNQCSGESADSNIIGVVLQQVFTVPPTPTSTPTPSPTATGTILPTSTATPTGTPTVTGTPTNTPTATPVEPFVSIHELCLFGPDVEFLAIAGNLDVTQDVYFYLNDVLYSTYSAQNHGPTIQHVFSVNGLADGVHEVKVQIGSGAGSQIANTTFELPCALISPTPSHTPNPLFSPTPLPADLVISALPQPEPVGTISAYQPLSVTVAIRNDGEIDIDSSIRVSLYLNPPEAAVLANAIYGNLLEGDQIVSGLDKNEEKWVTFYLAQGLPNASTAITNTVDTHKIYAHAQVLGDEYIDTNNISLRTVNSIPVSNPPTATPTRDHNDSIHIYGAVQALRSSWNRQPYASVFLIEERDGYEIVRQHAKSTDWYGRYSFLDNPDLTGDATYKVVACITIDNQIYMGTRINITTSDNRAHIYMIPQSGVCPYLPEIGADDPVLVPTSAPTSTYTPAPTATPTSTRTPIPTSTPCSYYRQFSSPTGDVGCA